MAFSSGVELRQKSCKCIKAEGCAASQSRQADRIGAPECGAFPQVASDLRWPLTPHPASATAVASATFSPQMGEGVASNLTEGEQADTEKAASCLRTPKVRFAAGIPGSRHSVLHRTKPALGGASKRRARLYTATFRTCVPALNPDSGDTRAQGVGRNHNFGLRQRSASWALALSALSGGLVRLPSWYEADDVFGLLLDSLA